MGSGQHERGNASLGFMVLGAAALIGVLSQTQGLINNRMKASQVKKINLEGHESGLYALSVARQMINKDTQPLPSFGFQNPMDPNNMQDIRLRSLEPNPNMPAVSLTADGSLQVTAPDLVKITAAQMDQLFQTKNFNMNQQITSVVVKPFAFDPFPSGYGIQTIYLEATAQLSQNDINSKLVTRAKVPVPPPDGNCIITAVADGTPIANGESVPTGTEVEVNLHCTGVVLDAKLFDLGKPLGAVKPTAACDYGSDIPKTLPTIKIVASGNHELEAEVKLVDETAVKVQSLLFTIANTGAGGTDPLLCRSKCTCVDWSGGKGNFCPGTTMFADPFPYVVGALPAPMPKLSANPIKDPSQLTILDNWAKANNVYPPGVHWQGAGYPNYPNVLVCPQVEQSFDLWAFDPAKNCEGKFVSTRSNLGCLKEGTRITIGPGGVTAPIETLRPGDWIWNPLAQSYRHITKVVAGPEKKPTIRLLVGKRDLTVTETHPMRTPAGYVMARELKAGDPLLLDGQWLSLDRIEAAPSGLTVWNLEMEPNSDDDQLAFEAEGIIVGDLRLQVRLESHEP